MCGLAHVLPTDCPVAEGLVTQAVYVSYVQTRGYAHGVYWDPSDMQVLADSPAMEQALKVSPCKLLANMSSSA